ncbi:hypothetical protein COY96_02930 [Candidatus Wolfebacteria bacterium CG_4_10_14_0_8_um_filter_37_11]|uniref:Protein containing YHS domain protein n=1 Tax=Candidatus Wolfebacteria bacterium CG_4_10_14_0_8_um_filter_37_11 TaxID=1975062 RepID=A0A2M7Q746_9BACT|nr:MAG: hypothetical protein COY96_02930 [Candidatus Wolfebacteria bacterium CG_4_10_14_0_8_um_filter_37_11]
MSYNKKMDKNICHTDFKYKICVSGAAETNYCGADAFSSAEELGREIVRHNAVLVDGATTGFPFWAAKGVKQEGGIVIGLSPAATEKEHIQTYQLPIEYHDMIIYTGFNYSGRNLLLVRSADAVIFGCGRMGTLNEFTITFEDKKPIGILQGGWETDELFKELIEKSHRAEEMKGKIVFDSDPKRLLDKLIEIIKKEKNNNHNHKIL